MRHVAVISYIIFIVIINVFYSYLPDVPVGANEISTADFLVGWVYLTRDFAQRQIGHWVILAMLIGTAISFWLANPVVANASVCAFAIGEAIDWIIFTFTRKPLSQRLLWSAGMSAPIDSFVFLWMANHLSGLELVIMTSIKLLGIYALWKYWQIRQKKLLPLTVQPS